jgi:anti-sigma B factor antagonist
MVNHAIVVEVFGEVDLNTVPELGQALEFGGNRVTRVVVDFAGVTFVDSSGLRVLVGSQQELAARGVSLRVVVPAKSVTRRVFEITDLVAALGIVATVDDALTQ